jgi:hypothetical protein
MTPGPYMKNTVMTLEVESSDNIYKLKAQIADNQGICVDEFQLFYSRGELSNNELTVGVMQHSHRCCTSYRSKMESRYTRFRQHLIIISFLIHLTNTEG